MVNLQHRPQILEKYSMSISQIKKQLLDHDFFKDWTIKNKLILHFR